MEIRHLQTFLAISDLGGFTKAADYLGYAQSTITSHIKSLENELGEELFERLGKKIILTSTGKKLVPYARQMLSLYGDIKNITGGPNTISGDLVIGAGESLSIYRLGEILKEYRQRFPKVNIILRNSICSDLRNKLHSGELDVIFTIDISIKDPDLIVKKLKDETMVLLSAPEVDLESFSSTVKSNLPRETIIFSEKGCSFRLFFENYLKQQQIKYANPLEFTSIEAIKNCVMNGLGISCLPLYTVSKELREGSLKAIEFQEPFNRFATQLAYHKNKKISPALRELIEVTLKYSVSWK